MPKGTSACCITWEFDRVVAAPPVSGCTDESLDALVGKADAIGIDAPSGWPEEFAKAVTAWTAAEWSEDLRDRLRFRKTDLYVQEPPFDPSPLRAWHHRIQLIEENHARHLLSGFREKFGDLPLYAMHVDARQVSRFDFDE